MDLIFLDLSELAVTVRLFEGAVYFPPYLVAKIASL